MAIFKRGKMTWLQLRLAHRHGLGSEKIARSSMLIPIPPRVTEDVDILAFRCIGIKPMLGFRLGRIFHIIWIDKNLTAYKH